MGMKFYEATAAQLAAATPAEQTLIMVTDTSPRRLYLGDGATQGGVLIGPIAASGVTDGATLSTGLTFPAAGLHILDTNASHDLIITPGSNLTADRTLTITTGDASRTLTISDDTSVPVASYAITFSGLTAARTYTLPDANSTLLYSGGALGTPASGTLSSCSGLPVSGITASTSTALGVGSIELGHASDTTLTRSSAGVLAVEGVTVSLNSTSATHTAGTIELGAASDTTLARASAGVVSVEGVNLGRVIASGTSALGTSAISSGAAATLVTTSATGVATTDVITWGFNTDPNAVTGYDAKSTSGCLVITAYPTANNVNFLVSNPTAGSITPGALTLNWRVVR